MIDSNRSDSLESPIAWRPRTILLTALILTLALNPSRLLISDSHFEFSVDVRYYLSDVILMFAWLHILASKTIKTSSLFSLQWVGPIHSILLLWVASGIVSTIFATNISIALMEIAGMIRILIIFLTVYYLIESKRDFTYVVVSLVCACCIQAVLILVQYASGDQLFTLPGVSQELDLITEGTIFRPGGTLGHSSNFAKLAALTIPICFAYVQSSLKSSQKLIFGFMFSMIMFALLLTLSRAGLGTAIFGIVWLLLSSLRTDRGRRIFAFSLVVCLIAFGSAWFVIGDRIVERISDDEGSALLRIPMFLTAGQVILHNPLGVGLNNYLNAANEYDDFGVLKWFPFPVHNIYLLYFAEIGIIGGSIFLWLLIKTIKSSFEASRYAEDELHATVLKSIGIGLCSSWLQGLVGWGHRQNVIHLAYLAVLAGVITAYQSIAAGNEHLQGQ